MMNFVYVDHISYRWSDMLQTCILSLISSASRSLHMYSLGVIRNLGHLWCTYWFPIFKFGISSKTKESLLCTKDIIHCVHRGQTPPFLFLLHPFYKTTLLIVKCSHPTLYSMNLQQTYLYHSTQWCYSHFLSP